MQGAQVQTTPPMEPAAAVRWIASNRLSRYPIGFLLVVFGWTITMAIVFNSHGVPIWIAVITYGVPVLGVSWLCYRIGNLPGHTRKDKKHLWAFFLACYLVGLGLFILTLLQSFYLYSDERPSGGFGASAQFLFVPFALLVPGLAVGVWVISGRSPRKHPWPYLAIVAGMELFLVFMLPLPAGMEGTQVPEVARNMDPWDGDFYWVWNAAGWEYHLTRMDVGSIGVMTQFSMGVCALVLGGLWALARPEQFNRSFGIDREALAEPRPEPQSEPTSRAP